MRCRSIRLEPFSTTYRICFVLVLGCPLRIDLTHDWANATNISVGAGTTPGLMSSLPLVATVS